LQFTRAGPRRARQRGAVAGFSRGGSWAFCRDRKSFDRGRRGASRNKTVRRGRRSEPANRQVYPSRIAGLPGPVRRPSDGQRASLAHHRRGAPFADPMFCYRARRLRGSFARTNLGGARLSRRVFGDRTGDLRLVFVSAYAGAPTIVLWGRGSDGPHSSPYWSCRSRTILLVAGYSTRNSDSRRLWSAPPGLTIRPRALLRPHPTPGDVGQSGCGRSAHVYRQRRCGPRCCSSARACWVGIRRHQC